jgi:hypothetical protein
MEPAGVAVTARLASVMGPEGVGCVTPETGFGVGVGVLLLIEPPPQLSSKSEAAAASDDCNARRREMRLRHERGNASMRGL